MASWSQGKFLKLPQTSLGWWGTGLMILCTALLLLIINDIIRFPGLFTMALTWVAFILVLAAIIWKKERSWLAWLMLVPGLFAVWFTIGEILYPH